MSKRSYRGCYQIQEDESLSSNNYLITNFPGDFKKEEFWIYCSMPKCLHFIVDNKTRTRAWNFIKKNIYK